MVNPGAFQGTRKAFLLSQKPEYELAVQGGYGKDAVAIIQRRYFKRYPVSLPHNVEPSPEHLENIDDDAPDEDPIEPDETTMSAADYKEAVEALAARVRLIVYRKSQIKRWLAYQYMKDHDLDPKESGLRNPFFVLLCQLTGTSTSRPRAQPAMVLFRRSERDTIEREVKAEAQAQGISISRGLVGLRSKITKKLFDNLSPEEKDDWQKQSKEEHDDQIAEWNAELKKGISAEPKDRQRCIETLTRFVQPILDGICEATGWKATLIAGGPEPAAGGKLNIISVHSGTTKGVIKMNFGRAEQTRYSKFITPVYADFLKKCYSVEECKSRALPEDEMGGGLASLIDEMPDATFEEVGFPNPSTSADVVNQPAAPPPSNVGASESTPSPLPATAGSQPAASQQTTVLSTATKRSTLAGLACRQTSSVPNTPMVHTQQGVAVDTPISVPSKAPQPEPEPPAHPAPRIPHQSSAPVPNMPPHSTLEEPIQPGTPSGAFSPPASPGGPECMLGSPLSGIPPRLPSPIPQTISNSSTGTTRAPSTSAPVDLGPPTPQNVLQAVVSNAPTGNTDSPAIASSVTKSKRPRASNPADKSNDEASSKKTKRRRVVNQAAELASGSCSDKENDVGVSSSGSGVAPSLWYQTWSTEFEVGSKGIGKKKNLWLGLEWQALVEEWRLFEQEHGFKSDTPRLPSLHRPPMIAAWIKNARVSTYRPKSLDVNATQASFDKWWAHVQPAWRKDEQGRVVSRRVDGDWSSLVYPGVNGLFSVVAALFFLGLFAHEVGRTRIPWVYAVEDVTLALSKLRSISSSS